MSVDFKVWVFGLDQEYIDCARRFFALLFMLYLAAAYVSYKFEREIQIQSNDLNSLAASIQEMLLGERFQRRTRSIN